jgi:hypothetical protein
VESFNYLQPALANFERNTNFASLNKELLGLPFQEYSTGVLMHILTKLFYWKSELPSYLSILNKVWHEIVISRGRTDLGDSIDSLV